MKTLKSLTFFVALVTLISGQAFSQSYVDVTGGDIDFTDIVETSGDGLFGQPTADGGSLDFPLSGFSAEGVDGAVDFVAGMIQLTASSNSGQAFSQVSLDEFGAYFNTGDSVSSVQAFLTVVTEDGLFNDSFHLTFGEGSGSWVGGVTVNFPATLEADIFFQNILLADSGVDEVAFVSKRAVGITVGVPEPTAFGIAALGLCGLALRRRR